MKFRISQEIPLYILGLWLGDKYWWSSSIGLTNTKLQLIQKFRKFLESLNFQKERIKLSVYTRNGRLKSKDKQLLSRLLQLPEKNIKPYKLYKGKRIVYILYVNSRPLKRKFEEASKNLESLINSPESLFEYLSGRIDADGNFEWNKNRIRIGYTTKDEAEKDAKIISKIVQETPKISYYSDANEWILEIVGNNWKFFIDKISQFIIKGDTLAQGHRQLVS